MCPLIYNCAVYKIILIYQNKIILFLKHWKRSFGSILYLLILYHIEDAKNSQTKYKMPVINQFNARIYDAAKYFRQKIAFGFSPMQFYLLWATLSRPLLAKILIPRGEQRSVLSLMKKML